MAKARLVKRSEVKKEEDTSQQPQTISFSQSVLTVREWIGQHQPRRPGDARQAFAQLFAAPQKA